MLAPPYGSPVGGDDPWSLLLRRVIQLGTGAYAFREYHAGGRGLPKLTASQTFEHQSSSEDIMLQNFCPSFSLGDMWQRRMVIGITNMISFIGMPTSFW